MPASHTTATLTPQPLLRDTQAVMTPAAPSADWRLQMRVAPGAAVGAAGVIAGTVMVDGTPDYPVARRVRLYRDSDGALIAETWSDGSTGAYSFAGINRSMAYTVLALDHTHNFRAVVADNLTPGAA